MLYSKEKLESIVKSNKSKAECLRALNKKPVGSNYKWFDKKIKLKKVRILVHLKLKCQIVE